MVAGKRVPWKVCSLIHRSSHVPLRPLLQEDLYLAFLFKLAYLITWHLDYKSKHPTRESLTETYCDSIVSEASSITWASLCLLNSKLTEHFIPKEGQD